MSLRGNVNQTSWLKMTEYALKAQPYLKLFYPVLVIKVARSSWILEMVAESSKKQKQCKARYLAYFMM
jgi:hypothetical protein